MRHAHLEEIVLLGARERDRLSMELARAHARIRELEAQLEVRADEYRRGYRAGWSKGKREQVAA